MPRGPGARIFDKTLHQLPGVLMPGLPSLNVFIGKRPAWKGVPAAAAAAMSAAKSASDTRLMAAKVNTLANAGSPSFPAAKAAEEALKVAEAAAMAATIMSASGGASIHLCISVLPIPLPPPPHGPGVVIDGSPTVTINNMQACRLGDTILEAFGPPDKIISGELTVIIGDSAAGSAAADAIKKKNEEHAKRAKESAKHFQGQQVNKDTCSLMSTASIVSESTGTVRTEAQMQPIGQGAANGYTPCNGTTNTGNVMTAAGVPATQIQNPTLEQIATALDNGQGVIVGHDAQEHWYPDPNDPRRTAAPQGHDMRVTGVVRGPDGKIDGFFVNDSGDGNAEKYVPAQHMQNALNGLGGGDMTTTNAPIQPPVR